MFKMYALDGAKEHDYSRMKLIGWIVSRSETRTSLWGDSTLFFQHQRMDDDEHRRPYYHDWVQNWTLGTFDFDDLMLPDPYVSCPFKFLFEEAGLAPK